MYLLMNYKELNLIYSNEFGEKTLLLRDLFNNITKLGTQIIYFLISMWLFEYFPVKKRVSSQC